MGSDKKNMVYRVKLVNSDSGPKFLEMTEQVTQVGVWGVGGFIAKMENTGEFLRYMTK